MRKKPTYYLGNFIIFLSLCGLLFIFFPVLTAYLYPPSLTVEERQSGYTLSIPRIKAEGKVIENVDPFQKDEYMSALKKGIAHAKGTSLPSEKGMSFLFAHSSGLPWELTRYNSVFLRLNELQKNDEIAINYKGEKYTYKVADKKEIYPHEVEYLLKQSPYDLILQTCTPIGTDYKRLLIFAQKVTS